MRQYTVVIERTGDGFGAYVPDLPGCIAAGGTREEMELFIRRAAVLHLKGMQADGESIPEPTTFTIKVEVPIAV